MFANGKITLASSTKTSLHDRFTKLAAAASTKEKKVVNKPQQPIKTAPIRASAKNRNLAMQMANKPSVQAALKIKNKTLKQRLGGLNTNIKPNPPGQQNNNKAPNRMNLKARLGGVVKTKPTRLSNRLNFRPNQPKISTATPAQSTLNLSANRVNRGGLRKQNSMRKLRNNNSAGNLHRVNNTGFKNKTKSPRIKNLKARVQTTGVKKFGKKFAAPDQTKKSLDMDLDEYMSKTKSHLDSDLDKYMAKSKTHLDADLDAYMSKATSQ